MTDDNERKATFYGRATDLDDMSRDETRSLVQELRVRQVELKVQNEELRLAHSELDTIRARYFDLYDHAPIGYCTVNDRGEILECNRTAALLLGTPQDDLRGISFSDFIYQGDLEVFRRHQQAILETKESQSCETRVARHDGSRLWVHLSCNPVAAEGDAGNLRVVLTDISQHKAAEKVTLARTAFFEAIADSPIDGVLVVDPNGKKIHQNNRLAELWSLPPEVANSDNDSFQVQYVSQLVKDPARFVDSVSRIYRHPSETFHDEIELLDGKVLERFTAPVLGPQGEYFGRVWTFRDLTARKRAEQGRLESLERLQKIASRLPGFVYQMRSHPDGRFTFPYASDGIWELMQIRPEDIRDDGKAAFDVVHADDLSAVMKSTQYSAEHLTQWKQEFRVKLQDGTIRWLAGSSMPEREPDGATLWHGHIGDITAAKNAEYELQHAKELLDEAQAMARMGSWSYEVASGRMLWSAERYRLFGRDPALGTPSYEEFLKHFEPSDAAILSRAFQALMDHGEPYSLVVRTIRADVGTTHVRCNGRARIDSSGNVVVLFGTSTDVTADVEREAAMRAAREEAESANRAKSEFLANMSHEIRTPLTAILGFAEILKEEKDGEAELIQRRHSIDTIISAGNHLLAIINDVLDLSKIEANKLIVEEIETSLPKVLLDIETLLRPRAIGKGLSLVTRLATPIPDRVICDPTRLRQILMNLIGNATKFTEEGSVTVTVGVTKFDDKEHLFIDVKDTGPGISLAKAEALFQPFTQADNTVTRSHGGTGLGLAISHRLASLLGGFVKLSHTKLGVGSCFRLVLPLVRSANSIDINRLDRFIASDDPNRVSNIELQGRILLAEDGIDNQRLIAFHLRRAGVSVDIAANGFEAIRMFDEAKSSGRGYDLLLTDIQMPELDGYGLTRLLRSRGETIAIIALTAHAMAEDRQKGIDAGCDDYITKPIDKLTLLSVCANYLGFTPEHQRD